MTNVTTKTTVTLRAAAECPSHSLANVSVDGLEMVIDEPVVRGGTNLGPTPTATALAALIGCTNVIGHKCAKKLGVDIGHLKISAACEFDRRGVTLQEEINVPFTKIILDVEVNGGASVDEILQVAQEVSKFCPLSKLYRQAGTDIEERWKKV